MFCKFEESERMDDVYMCVNLDYSGKTEKKERRGKGRAILDSVYTLFFFADSFTLDTEVAWCDVSRTCCDIGKTEERKVNNCRKTRTK